jgi:riboflavin kinase/FMN adenylyltransferase
VNTAPASGFLLQRDLENIPAALTGGVVAIGNFDGVHLGHKAVMAAARVMAASKGVAALALTFEPHPRSFFRPDLPIPRLTPPAEKRFLLSQEGLTGMIELNFDAALAGLSAEDFVASILVDKLKVAAVTVGWDFHFGKGRGGTPEFLVDAGKRHGFDVRVVQPFGGEEPVSSSKIRGLLKEGHLDQANRLLGYRWFVMGEVVHGEKRGRQLGFPTANMQMAPETPLAEGVYAVRVAFEGHVYGAVANFGRKLQFHDNAPPLLESYLFDFSGDLYGETLSVEFLARLRGEAKFASVKDLVDQMGRDSYDAGRIAARPADPFAPSVIG